MRPTSACRSRWSIPKPNPGGVCLYRGCIPSKALLHVADVINEATHAEAWGVELRRAAIDVDELRAFKNKVVAELTGGAGQVSKLRKIELPAGHGGVPRPETLTSTWWRQEGDADVRARDHCDRLAADRGPGLSIDNPRVMDSTGALDLPDIPKSLLVVGGGYIGLELG